MLIGVALAPTIDLTVLSISVIIPSVIMSRMVYAFARINKLSYFEKQQNSFPSQ